MERIHMRRGLKQGTKRDDPFGELKDLKTLKVSTILPIQEKKKQDYNNTVIGIDQKHKNCPQGSAGTVSSVNQILKGRPAFRSAKLSSLPTRRFDL
jgi:hypothetical protein